MQAILWTNAAFFGALGIMWKHEDVFNAMIKFMMLGMCVVNIHAAW